MYIEITIVNNENHLWVKRLEDLSSSAEQLGFRSYQKEQGSAVMRTTTQQHLLPYSACEVNNENCCWSSMSSQGFQSRGVGANRQTLTPPFRRKADGVTETPFILICEPRHSIPWWHFLLNWENHNKRTFLRFLHYSEAAFEPQKRTWTPPITTFAYQRKTAVSAIVKRH